MLAPTKITPSCLHVLWMCVHLSRQKKHVTIHDIARELWTKNTAYIRIAIERLSEAGLIALDSLSGGIKVTCRWIPANELDN